VLLCFTVKLVLAAARAELLKFQARLIVAPVLLSGVVPLAAFSAFQRDDRSDIFLCHADLGLFLSRHNLPCTTLLKGKTGGDDAMHPRPPV
jgi:hypothetical protein